MNSPSAEAECSGLRRSPRADLLAGATAAVAVPSDGDPPHRFAASATLSLLIGVVLLLADGIGASWLAGLKLGVLDVVRRSRLGARLEVQRMPFDARETLARRLRRDRVGAFRKRWRMGVAIVLMVSGQLALAAGFGHKDGPEPGNVDAVLATLREDPYELELLISFGTSKGGSAGHLALAIRDNAGAEESVFSANFYADRDPAHAEHRLTEDLMLKVPKGEYLFGTRSSLGDKASFGLDFGEIYKRAVVGVRVSGVPAAERRALVAFFDRVNEDYRRRARYTDYHGDEVKYGYLALNCAKTIGMAFRRGAAYEDLEVKEINQLFGSRVVGALASNIPTEMAMKLMRAWHARGYGLDVVLYKKFEGSTYVDPFDDEPIAFKDLPNRFPSVLSRDFLREQGEYEDYDNLYAMYLLYNLGRYSVRIDERSHRVRIEASRAPMPYAAAAESAALSARADSDAFRRHVPFEARGTAIGRSPDNSHLYHFDTAGTASTPKDGAMPAPARQP